MCGFASKVDTERNCSRLDRPKAWRPAVLVANIVSFKKSLKQQH